VKQHRPVTRFGGYIKDLSPKVFIVHHSDDWDAPFSETISEANLKRGRAFEPDARAVGTQIKVVIPNSFETHTLE
jgi:hypothetical protein